MKSSTCCEMPLWEGGICSGCKEHAGAIKDCVVCEEPFETWIDDSICPACEARLKEEKHHCDFCDALLPNTKDQIELANVCEKHGFGMICEDCLEKKRKE